MTGCRYIAKYENSFEPEETDLVRIDGLKIGNEMRYINDSRNTGRDVNVQFILAWIGERTRRTRVSFSISSCSGGSLHLFVVSITDIKKGEEIMIDYGSELRQRSLFFFCFFSSQKKKILVGAARLARRQRVDRSHAGRGRAELARRTGEKGARKDRGWKSINETKILLNLAQQLFGFLLIFLLTLLGLIH